MAKESLRESFGKALVALQNNIRILLFLMQMLQGEPAQIYFVTNTLNGLYNAVSPSRI